jgi:predicted nuclease of restriction endonuclease-like (RecB) superfamily
MDNQIERFNSEEVYTSIRSSVITAQNKVYAAVNSAMVIAYWEIGEQIHKACGENDRAGYGKNLLSYLSVRLTTEFGKGFDESNLRRMRQFYLTYPIRDTLCHELSWSHYRVLMKLSDKTVRDFYTEECIKSAWSVRQLERQINTMYYQRLLASQDKASVAAEIQRSEPKPEYEKAIKDPYIMEFLQIKPDTHVYESDIEQALIDHLQQFLLELGRGFSFVSRQKRFTLNGQDFFIDLVFYNYILKCFVLIDLKADKLTHQDIGQMQMYVNYYTRELMNEGDNPPIGIVLCAEKNDAVVRYTLPEDNSQIFASKYFTYLPTEEELKRELRIDGFIHMDDSLTEI